MDGLFTSNKNFGQFGITLGSFLNPSTSGKTDSFKVEVVTTDGNLVAQGTADISFTVKDPIDPVNCSPE